MTSRLPPLRQELLLTPGAPLIDGSAGYILSDPLRSLFFQLGGLEQRILQLWQLRDPDLIRAALMNDGVGRDEATAALEAFHRFAVTQGLLYETGAQAVASKLRQRAAAQRSWWQWLLEHYLFVRIPLVHPGDFLRRTLPWVSRLWSPPGVMILAFLGLSGILLVARQWDHFVDNLASLASTQGVIAYMCALVVVKCLHEAGHAYTATRFGCRVPTMGVSLLVMLPVLYTDTSSAWRLRSRRQRMLIDSAGILAELSVAAVALFLWSFLPEGPLRTVAFVLATTSLATTLLVNASPFMRFDGYFLLSDAVGIPNLAPRAFALLRWKLREGLFALGESPPESLPRHTLHFMIGYGVVTLIYRTVLYIGIALVVYHTFFKALGIALFIVEVIVFLIRPLLSELKEWSLRRRAILANRRTRMLLGGVIVTVVVSFLPLDRFMNVPAILAPIGNQVVVTGEPAVVTRVLVRNGDWVKKGQLLVQLSSPALDLEEHQSQIRIAQLERQIARGVADEKDRASLTVLKSNLLAERDRLEGLMRRQAALAPRATIDGQVVDQPTSLGPGVWTGGQAPLLHIITPQDYDVRAYAPEDSGWRLHTGVVGRFVPDDATMPSWPVRLDEVGGVAVSSLDQPMLASKFGGPIAVKPSADHDLMPEKPMLVLRLAAEQREIPGLPRPILGRISLPVDGESLVDGVWRAVARVLVRETSVQ
ncbi:biotin/lipoyl-binding protein [Pseudomonas fluorescens]|uniref:site-2 protease family protein n=1 Tax=Pseudomonas fluorescens TaxID=294 RepID=UPI001130D05D|nr:site-2 protease family protein [Pseudomonas fluorescens]TMU74677.1 biotin/lipoyl-binding protein [Pseudomonas fluorescens]